MSKMRFVDAAGIDKAKLRLRRKEVMGYAVFALLFAKAPSALLNQVAGVNGITLVHILAGIIFVFVALAFIFGIRSLFRLTKMIYVKPTGYFIGYLVLIFFGGLVLGLFAIIGLLLVWFEARKFLSSAEVRA